MKIGLKLIGVYFIVIALSSAPSVLVSYEVAHSSNFQHPSWAVLSNVTNIILMLTIGFFLSLKTEIICSLLLKDNEVKEDISSNINLSLVIKVLGLFLAAGSVGNVIEGVITALTVESSFALYINMLVPGAVTIAVGILLIYKAEVISKYMGNTKNEA
jgi:Na+-driven multidrug efflux pump